MNIVDQLGWEPFAIEVVSRGLVGTYMNEESRALSTRVTLRRID